MRPYDSELKQLINKKNSHFPPFLNLDNNNINWLKGLAEEILELREFKASVEEPLKDWSNDEGELPDRLKKAERKYKEVRIKAMPLNTAISQMEYEIAFLKS